MRCSRSSTARMLPGTYDDPISTIVNAASPSDLPVEVLSWSFSGNVLTIQSNGFIGTAEVTVTATDAGGLSRFAGSAPNFLSGSDGFHVILHSLTAAEPLAGVKLRLVAANNQVLGEAKTNDKDAVAWRDLLEKLRNALEAGTPVRDIDLDSRETEKLRGIHLITAKPVMYVANLAEGDRVVTRFAAIGTNTGPLGDLPASGNETNVGGIIITSQRRGPREHIYLVLLVIVAVAFLTDKLWVAVGRRLFPYREATR